jgi:hypothetical protein
MNCREGGFRKIARRRTFDPGHNPWSRIMLPTPFYDEVPADIGGNEVWLRAQAAADEDPPAASGWLLRRLAAMWSSRLVAAPAWPKPQEP